MSLEGSRGRGPSIEVAVRDISGEVDPFGVFTPTSAGEVDPFGVFSPTSADARRTLPDLWKELVSAKAADIIPAAARPASPAGPRWVE